MADGEQNGAEDRKPTERVILEQVKVLVLPVGFDAAQLTGTEKEAEAALMALAKGGKRTRGHVGVAWLEVHRTTAVTKTAAIESYAGKAGTPDAKIGTFRAPTVTAWKGAVVYDAPPAPLVQRSLID